MSLASQILSLGRVYADLMVAARTTASPEYEDGPALVRRISVPGRINEINAEAYAYFLHAWPPRLYGGNRFCFAAGDEPLRLFWEFNGCYFCRQLTRQETNRLCDASGLPREYGLGLAQ